MNSYPSGITNAAIIPKEDVDPDDFPGISLSSSSSALTSANSQLNSMQYGNILTLNGNCEDFVGRLIYDYEIGNILYWELSDDDVIINIDAYSSEIIFYQRTGWTDGDLTEAQALALAPNIANQFCSIPSDADQPSISLETPIELAYIDPSTNNYITTDCDFWYIEYYRIREQIVCEDYIRVAINPNGYLHIYSKIWFMDFTNFNYNYTITLNNAVITAQAYLSETFGESGTYKSGMKRIIRPNYCWNVTEGPEDEDGNKTLGYGLEQMVVWEILIQTSDLDQFILQVHGRENRIVGGDITPLFYST